MGTGGNLQKEFDDGMCLNGRWVLWGKEVEE